MATHGLLQEWADARLSAYGVGVEPLGSSGDGDAAAAGVEEELTWREREVGPAAGVQLLLSVCIERGLFDPVRYAGWLAGGGVMGGADRTRAMGHWRCLQRMLPPPPPAPAPTAPGEASDNAPAAKRRRVELSSAARRREEFNQTRQWLLRTFKGDANESGRPDVLDDDELIEVLLAEAAQTTGLPWALAGSPSRGNCVGGDSNGGDSSGAGEGVVTGGAPMMCQPRQRSGSTPLPITPAVPTPAGFNEATPCSPVSPVVQTPAGGGTVQPLHAPGVSLVSGFADVGGAFADARLLFDLWHLHMAYLPDSTEYSS